ncbi:MAG: FecR family protein [Candidatus Dormibacteria bacterium]
MNSERIEEAAARWFARRESGTWTEDDQVDFEAWLMHDPAHRIAYIRLDAAWSHAARMKALGAGVPPGVIPPRRSWGDTRFFGVAPAKTNPQLAVESPEEPGPQPRGRARASGNKEGHTRRRRMRLFAIAATALLALSGGIYVYTTGIFAGEQYTTKVGGLDTVPLADGSRVTLNTDSRIRVALAAKEREVQLERGEAFFVVAKDPRRPFVVEAGDKRVIALGTQFSVLRNGDDIRVVVTEGKVRIEDVSSPGSADVLVSAGSIAQTANAQVLVRTQATPEVEQLLSWRSGYVAFRDMALADAVAEFNRYNTRKILIEDPSIAAIRIGGNFRSNNVDAFLSLLQRGFPIIVEQNDDEVILKRRP